ncbi:unnamed protein product, partial [Rotaria sp. Silwood1]
MFRFGSIFRIRSIDLAPDSVRYARLRYADTEFQLIQERLQLQVGGQLTWLTPGKYLCALNHSNAAKSYYQYLINALPENHEALPSIHNNTGLIYAQLGEDETALKHYEVAINLLHKVSPNTQSRLQSINFKLMPESTEPITTIDGCI